MKHLWKVEFEIKYSGIGEWIGDETFRVVSNGDGQKAVRIAERLALRREFDDAGTWRKARRVRLVGLEQVVEISE